MATLLKVVNDALSVVEQKIPLFGLLTLTNNYLTWTNSGFTLYASNSRCSKVSYHDTDPEVATIHLDFTLYRAANTAYITAECMRILGQWTENPGIAESTVTLIDADSIEHALYSGEGDLSWDNVLDGYNITTLLNKAGTYTIELKAETQSSWIYESGYIWDESEVHFGTFLLVADTRVTTTKTLTTETTTPIATVGVYKYNLDGTEVVTPIESFLIQVFTPPVSLAAIIYVGTSTDHKISSFFTGVQLGHFDTPEVDFNTPGRDKTLDEIQFAAQTTTPHTVAVYVSLNGGVTWIYVGQDTIYKGKTGFVHPWLTAESFIVRFYGTALHLFSYGLFAVPSGMQIRTS